MKVAIISHDVDHVGLIEHAFDLFVPKLLARSLVELVLGCISAPEFVVRFAQLLRNRANNIETLLAFDKARGVPSTFFVAAKPGLNLKYGSDTARLIIGKIQRLGFEVGLHSTAAGEPVKISEETAAFAKMSRLDRFGVRMHYLAHNEQQLRTLSKSGFLYDSSEFSPKPPYKIDGMWEFPVHIMDCRIFERERKWQNVTLGGAIELTVDTLQRLSKETPVVSIIFHDHYFHQGYKTWRLWYEWLVCYLVEENYQLLNYRQAVSLLESNG